MAATAERAALALPSFRVVPTLARMGRNDFVDVIDGSMGLCILLVALAGATAAALVGRVVVGLRSQGAAAVAPFVGGAVYGATAAGVSHLALDWAGSLSESVVAGGLLGSVFGIVYAALVFVPLFVAVQDRTRPTLASADATALYWALWPSRSTWSPCSPSRRRGRRSSPGSSHWRASRLRS